MLPCFTLSSDTLVLMFFFIIIMFLSYVHLNCFCVCVTMMPRNRFDSHTLNTCLILYICIMITSNAHCGTAKRVVLHTICAIESPVNYIIVGWRSLLALVFCQCKHLKDKDKIKWMKEYYHVCTVTCLIFYVDSRPDDAVRLQPQRDRDSSKDKFLSDRFLNDRDRELWLVWCSIQWRQHTNKDTNRMQRERPWIKTFNLFLFPTTEHNPCQLT